MNNLGDSFIPCAWDETGKPTFYKWDFDKYYNSMSSVRQRNWDRRHKVDTIVNKLYRRIPWMNWPVIKVVYAFWNGIFDEGIKATIKPRWGLMTFAYLNDGHKPTLWHTWRQITRGPQDKYTGLYVGFADKRGAPKSLKQAQEWEKEIKYNIPCDDCGRRDGTHNFEIEH